MTTPITDLQTLQTYLRGMMEGRPDDDHPRIQHAADVSGAVLAMAGGVLWRADPGSICLRSHAGRQANMIWATIDGRSFCFAYNHNTRRVEIRDRNQLGPAIFSFDNSSSLTDIWAAFERLGRDAEAAA